MMNDNIFAINEENRDEIQRLNKEAYEEAQRREEIQRLNEEVFRMEQDQASQCPHHGHINQYTCDGCSIIAACSSLPTGY